MKKRARLTITGLVQGVSYRAATVEAARRHGLSGWVRNNPNGSVEAVVEGDEAQADLLGLGAGQTPGEAAPRQGHHTPAEREREAQPPGG